jgi:hypothetical protein
MVDMSDENDALAGGRRGWLLGVVMFAALLLMTATFIWAIVQIDPLVQDFIPGVAPPTATPAAVE